VNIADLAVVGGNLALDFVNTGGPGHGDEALQSYQDVVAWAEHVGAVGPADTARLLRRAHRDPDTARAEFDRAVGVRDSLSALLGAVVEGRTPDASALAALRSEEARALDHARLVREGTRFTWAWDGDDHLARPIWLVAHAAVELLTGDRLDRIKRCGGCPYLFFDESRNRSRRWCSMNDCGTDQKVRRFVVKRREAARAR
jgi:predicted RNA-binding Zn ribbon-like protein